jgi:cell division inhibitor SulA/protein ImuA
MGDSLSRLQSSENESHGDSPTIEQLLESNRNLWRGRDHKGESSDTIATGFAELDTMLPAGGWPMQGLVEMVSERWGVGELQLFLPLMRHLIARGNWVLWIAPPYSPYAPGLAQAGIDLRRILIVGGSNAPLRSEAFWGKKAAPEPVSSERLSSKEALWSMEKALQTQHCGLVLAWHSQLPQPTLRRLQLAAITGKTLGVVFMSKNSEHSPSSMRLKIKSSESDGAEPAYAEVGLLKARGSYRQSTARINLGAGTAHTANLTIPAAVDGSPANKSSKAESPQRGPDHD